MKSTGIVLVIIGIVMLIYTGFNFKTKEKVIDLGPIEVNREKNHTVNWPPVIGGILIAGGILIIIKDRKK